MGVISGGELVLSDTTPTYSRTWHYPGMGLALSGEYASYAAIYRTQLMVGALVNKLAYNVARLPLKVYERNALDRTEVDDHPLARLLGRPNPKHDPFFFWLWTASTFFVHGEALWAKVRDRRGLPVELWPLHPANVYTRRAGDDEPDPGSLVYVFHLGASTQPKMEIPERDVVHFRTYNPDNTLRGLSPLESLRMTLLNEDATRRASAAFWSNGARPAVVLSHPKELSDGAAKRLKASWDAIHAGVDNFGRTAVLEEGMEPHILQISAEDAQYIATRKLNQEEACIAYDMPPPAMHILDHATYSNITEQMRSVYRDTMAPRLSLFEAAIDQHLRSDFDGDVYAEFLLDEVMRGSFEDRQDAMAKAVGAGLLTPAEGRKLENRPYIEGSDRLYINSTFVPLESVPAGSTAAPSPAVSDPAALRAVG